VLAIAVLHQLGHVPALGRGERGHAPIVEDQDVDAGEPHEQSCVGAIGAGQGELVEEPRGTAVDRPVAATEGVLSEGAGDEGLADAGRPGDGDVLVLGDPLTGRQLADQGLVDDAPVIVVEVLEAGAAELEVGLLDVALEAGVVAGEPLGVDEEAEALVEAEAGVVGLGLLFDPRRGEAVALCGDAPRRRFERLAPSQSCIHHRLMPSLPWLLCSEQRALIRAAFLSALTVAQLTACAKDKIGHSGSEASTAGTSNTGSFPTTGNSNTTSSVSITDTSNTTSSPSATSTSNTTSESSTTGASNTTTGGFQWPQFPPVQCGDTLCVEGQLCVYNPGFSGCCAGTETDGSTGSTTTAGGMECDTGYDAVYRCKSFPDTCANSPEPFNCLSFHFCGGPGGPFDNGFLECGDSKHDCTTGE